MSREENSISFQNTKENMDQREEFITKVKKLNNRILNNKFKINLLVSSLSSLFIIIMISINSDIAYHRNKFEKNLFHSIGFSFINFNIIYNKTKFNENFSFCRMGDCKQNSYKDFNLTDFDVHQKEFKTDICKIFDIFKVSGYVVNIFLIF